MSWITKFFKFREQSDGEIVKPFLDHMEDLRWTIFKVLGTLVIGMVLSFFFARDLTQLLEQPLLAIQPKTPFVEAGGLQVLTDALVRRNVLSVEDAEQIRAGMGRDLAAAPRIAPLMVTNITESFMISLSLAFYAGIVITFPFLLYFLAEFVLPALSRQEKRYLFPAIAIGFLLFALGVFVCFRFILPQTLEFFYDYGAALQFDNRWRAREYFSFVTHLCLAFGLLCELPVAIVALAALGLISFSWLSRTRAYAVVIILILAAVIAPTPDPLTFISMGAPIIILYEICIWIVWLMERRTRKRAASAKDFPE